MLVRSETALPRRWIAPIARVTRSPMLMAREVMRDYLPVMPALDQYRHVSQSALPEGTGLERRSPLSARLSPGSLPTRPGTQRPRHWNHRFRGLRIEPLWQLWASASRAKSKYSSTPSAMPLNPRAQLRRKTSLSYPFAGSSGCLGARGRRRVETTRPALRRPRVSVFVRRELCWRAKCDTFVDLVRDWPNCGLPIPYPAAMKCSRCGHGVSNEGIPINLPPDGSRYREGRQYAQQGTKGRDCRQAAPGQRKT